MRFLFRKFVTSHLEKSAHPVSIDLYFLVNSASPEHFSESTGIRSTYRNAPNHGVSLVYTHNMLMTRARCVSGWNFVLHTHIDRCRSWVISHTHTTQRMTSKLNDPSVSTFIIIFILFLRSLSRKPSVTREGVTNQITPQKNNKK